MKKLLIALASSLLLTTSASAGVFYQDNVPNWTIGGHDDSKEIGPACYIRTEWQDGSAFELVKRLSDGEVFIWFQNMQWNISDPVNQNYELRMNIHGSKGSVIGGTMSYILLSKNTIVIPQIDTSSFVEPFMNLSVMQLIMPGNIENAQVSLSGSTQAVIKMADCIKKFEKSGAQPKQNNGGGQNVWQ